MAKKDSFDSINIPEPCAQNWEAMRGDDQSRFCAACEKDIYNLSEMTRRQAKKLVFASKESVCVRMEKEANGKIKTLKKQLHQISRRVPAAAGVLSASLAFAAVADAQKKTPRPPIGKVAVSNVLDAQSTASISGTITDAGGAAIPNVSIILRDAKSRKIRRATSNENGFYEFKNVAVAAYEVEVKAAEGFRRYSNKNIKINGDDSLDLPIVLETAARRVLLGILQ